MVGAGRRLTLAAYFNAGGVHGFQQANPEENMAKKLAAAMFTLLAFACLSWAAPKSWTGTVSDDMCGNTKHDMACVEKCVAGGHAKYILVSKDKIYTLQPQDRFKGLGGKQVKVTGSLSGDAITAESVKVK
jgi:hypothetical protein